jgi:hypothetical protein
VSGRTRGEEFEFGRKGEEEGREGAAGKGKEADQSSADDVGAPAHPRLFVPMVNEGEWGAAGVAAAAN